MNTPETQNPQFGVPLDEAALYYFLSFGVAILVVFLFSLRKFDESTIEGPEGDFISQLPLKYLATREEYARGQLIYIGTMVVTLVAFSLLGPRALALGGAEVPALGNALPLFVAFVLVGVIPNFPMLQEVERNLRHFARKRAYIPVAARATAEKMAAAQFDFTRYNTDAILELPAMAGVEPKDFTRPRGSIEHSWARLCCLAYEMQWGEAADSVGTIDEALWNKLEEDRQRLAPDVAQYREQKQKAPTYYNEELHRSIRKTLGKLHLLLGCSVRLGLGRSADINIALRKFGFVLVPMPPRGENQDLIVVGLTVMGGSLLALFFVATMVSSAWTPSDDFPATYLAPFMWTLSAVSAHGIAIVIAEYMRSGAIRKDKWFRSGPTAQRPRAANHIRVAAACAVGGYVVLVLWGLVSQSVTPALLKGMAAYALMPAITGGFYAYHLDNVALGRRPPRWREIGSQSLMTGCCGIAACSARLGLVGSSPAQGYDLIILVALFGAVIGCSLAWYIPEAAGSDKYDPLNEVKAERVKMLEVSALKHFGDAVTAGRWLEQPQPRLRNRTPKVAALDADTYEDAIGLLQGSGPRPVLVA